MKKRWTFLILLPVVSLTFSQDFEKAYYNQKWELTSMDDATYFRISGFNPDKMKFDSTVIDHYMDNNIEMIGQYILGSKEGDFIYYYPDQSVRLKTSYSDNKRAGVWTEYYQNGQIFKEVSYENNKERIIQYNNSQGISNLKDLSGSFRMIYYYNSYFDVFANHELDTADMEYTLLGNIHNGLKDGIWTLKSGSKKICQLYYKEGNFIRGDYFVNNTKQGIKDDIFSILILEPEKLKITEKFFAERGQIIKENYLLRVLQKTRQRPENKFEFRSEQDVLNYFNRQYSVFVKNCADTFRIQIQLGIDPEGKVSIKSISPDTRKAHTTEINRIINNVIKIKSPSQDSILINYRVLCIDELRHKK
jgi:antitoxin component YwqK of YwqJK toxin-antitoxin module